MVITPEGAFFSEVFYWHILYKVLVYISIPSEEWPNLHGTLKWFSGSPYNQCVDVVDWTDWYCSVLQIPGSLFNMHLFQNLRWEIYAVNLRVHAKMNDLFNFSLVGAKSRTHLGQSLHKNVVNWIMIMTFTSIRILQILHVRVVPKVQRYLLDIYYFVHILEQVRFSSTRYACIQLWHLCCWDCQG
jgi:hypothetical protein